MKILITSDSHGHVDDLVNYINKNDFKFFIHVGDFCKDAEKISRITGLSYITVRGNNDFSLANIPFKKVLNLNGLKILLVHGHKEDVNFTKDILINEAVENSCKLVIFGHTHTYFDYYDKEFKIRLLNPGSVSLPRDGQKSFAILYIDDDSRNIEIEKICI